MSINNTFTTFLSAYQGKFCQFFSKIMPKKCTEANIDWSIIADYLPLAVFLIDENGNAIRSNKTVGEWTSQNSEQTKNRNIHDIMHPDCKDRNCYLKNLSSSLINDLKSEKFIQLEKEDVILNKYFTILVYPADVYLPQDGIKISAVFIMYDMTEEKETEKRLIELYKHLGMLNRQIDILSKIDERKKIESKKEIIKDILSSSRELSHSNASLLYALDKNKNAFNLLSMEGITAKQSFQIRKISCNSSLASELEENQRKIFGNCEEYGIRRLNGSKEMKFFLAVPLIKEAGIEGLIIFLYNKKRYFTDQELFFYKLFSTELYSTLKHIKAIE